MVYGKTIFKLTLGSRKSGFKTASIVLAMVIILFIFLNLESF